MLIVLGHTIEWLSFEIRRLLCHGKETVLRYVSSSSIACILKPVLKTIPCTQYSAEPGSAVSAAETVQSSSILVPS